MFERFARSARTAVEDARFEAERRGDRRIGSDHLLTALLRDDELARRAQVDAETVYRTAEHLDRESLVAIGLDPARLPGTGRASLRRRSMPFTTGAKDVLRGSLSAAAAERSREITGRHLLLAVLDQRAPDPAAELLDALAVDRAAARSRLDRG